MKQIVTGDKSFTFFNEKYEEHYHSVKGALEEAFKKFVEPAGIKELARKGRIDILDVCFGIGYNSLAAIVVALRENPHCDIRIVALEDDEKIINEMKNINLGELEQFYEILRSGSDNVKISFRIGDARKEVKKIKSKFDVVFLDPFSPKKCPELWTLSFFKDIKKVMKKKAILTTYSCARVVRENLKKAGLSVKDGPKVGRRGPSSVAVNN